MGRLGDALIIPSCVLLMRCRKMKPTDPYETYETNYCKASSGSTSLFLICVRVNPKSPQRLGLASPRMKLTT
jgi:hypothetical protein